MVNIEGHMVNIEGWWWKAGGCSKRTCLEGPLL